TGVTAGTAATDAANVGQVNEIGAVANKGWNIQTNGDTATNVAPGGTVQLNDGQNIKLTRDGSTVTVATADDLVASSLTAGNTLVNNNGVTLSGGSNGTVSLGNSGLNNGGNKITNVAAGTADTDAVNVSQLSSTGNDLTTKGLNFTGDSGETAHRDLGEALAIKGGAAGTLTDGNIGVVSNGSDTLSLKLAKDINLGNEGSLTTGNTVVNNAGVTISGGSNGTVSLGNGGLDNGGNTITNVKTGTADTDAANVGQVNEIGAVANKGWNIQTNGDTATNVAPGGTVQLNDGQNIKLTRDGSTVTVATADDLVASSLTAGNTLVNNNGVTLSGGNNGTVSLGNSGLNNGGNKITNVAAGTADTDAVNVSQLSSTGNDLTTKGLNFTGDSGETAHRDLGEALAIKGGAAGTLTDGNIGVVSNGSDTLSLKLAKDINLGNEGSLTTGNTVVNNAGVTISGGSNGTVSLDNTGLNNGGNRITNVAAGTLAANSTDAVNGSQLYNVQQQASQPLTFAG
ncbi:hypothetical protein L2C91_14875, partial [Rosenbergiella epipactidis]|uniref:beta strand repeat-containing protein n=1 Tax=Rosenbergiella epipactidis TaxID=1544694 RepID=UPI003D6BF686|nr:hypothetical protein [Rosenbergiella epipactidis]